MDSRKKNSILALSLAMQVPIAAWVAPAYALVAPASALQAPVDSGAHPDQHPGEPVVIGSRGAVTSYSIGDSGAPVLVSWKAKTARPKAIILSVHGFGFNKCTYHAFAERISEAGISTYAIDIRGFGEWSQSVRVNRRLNLLASLGDIKHALHYLHDQNPDLPIFLLGESMGGALALKAASDSPELVSGVISSVPSGERFKQKRTAMSVFIQSIFGVGTVDVGKQLVGQTTGDSELAGQLLSRSGIRARYSTFELLAFAKFMREGHASARRLSHTPVLMVQGARDRLVKPSGTERLFQELTTTDKSMLLVKGAEHLVFEEGQFDDQVISSVTDWLERHMESPTLASAGR